VVTAPLRRECQRDDESFGGVISNKNAFSCVLACSRPFFPILLDVVFCNVIIHATCVPSFSLVFFCVYFVANKCMRKIRFILHLACKFLVLLLMLFLDCVLNGFCVCSEH
jgi:hypothetical protein